MLRSILRVAASLQEAKYDVTLEQKAPFSQLENAKLEEAIHKQWE